MNYKDINDKWKSFLVENTFKEDVIFDPKKEKKKHLKDKSKKKHKEDDKEIITNEWEEFQHQDQEEMDEIAAPDMGSPGPVGYADTVEEEQLEEMSAVSGGPGASSIEGHAGGSKGPWMSKKAFKRKWS